MNNNLYRDVKTAKSYAGLNFIKQNKRRRKEGIIKSTTHRNKKHFRIFSSNENMPLKKPQKNGKIYKQNF